MSMKYVAAYLISVLAGNEHPTGDSVREIIQSVGGDVDDTIVKKLITEMEGKTPHEVIAAGMTKLQSIPTGGGGAAAEGATATAAAAVEAPAEKEPEPEEEEEDEDMGLGLFG